MKLSTDTLLWFCEYNNIIEDKFSPFHAYFRPVDQPLNDKSCVGQRSVNVRRGIWGTGLVLTTSIHTPKDLNDGIDD